MAARAQRQWRTGVLTVRADPTKPPHAAQGAVAEAIAMGAGLIRFAATIHGEGWARLWALEVGSAGAGPKAYTCTRTLTRVR